MSIRKRFSKTRAVLFALLAAAGTAGAQETTLPPPGVRAGIFFSTLRQDFGGRKVVKGEPFSADAVTRTVQTLADGNVIRHESKSQLYRDSTGRTRREFTLGAFGPWQFARLSERQVVVISDPAANVRYILNPARHTAFELPKGRFALRIMGGRENSGTAPPPRGARPQESGGDYAYLRVRRGLRRETRLRKTVVYLGKRTAQGLELEGTEIVRTIPAGAIGNERPIKIVTKRWFSPKLQLDVMSERSDPRFGVTTYRLENIRLQAPPANLFQVPANYTLRRGPVALRGHPH